MAGEQIILDPTSEDATNTQLDVTSNAGGYWLLKHDYPTPEDDEVWAYSSDTEGERRANTRPKNRTITATVRCREASGTPVIGTIVGNLQQKIAKLNREGGTYKRLLPSGDVIVFDVISARIPQVPSDQDWATLKKADVALSFTCKPYGRGAPVTTLSTHTETTGPVLIFTETGIKGDVAAPARLVITGATSAWYAVAVRSRRYDSATSARLLLEPGDADCTIGASGAATAMTGTSSGTVARFTDVATIYNTASIQWGPMTQRGTYRVYARVRCPTTNTGTVSLKLYVFYAGVSTEVDLPAVTFDPASEDVGVFRLLDLGLIRQDKSDSSPETLGWTLGVIAKSTVATDDVDIDYVLLMPVDECFAVARGIGFDPSVNVGGGAEYRYDGAFVSDGTPATARVRDLQGDLFTIPPAGKEARTLQVALKICSGGTADGEGHPFDYPIDDLSGKLIYTPRYLAVPEP